MHVIVLKNVGNEFSLEAVAATVGGMELHTRKRLLRCKRVVLTQHLRCFFKESDGLLADPVIAPFFRSLAFGQEAEDIPNTHDRARPAKPPAGMPGGAVLTG